MVAKSAIGYVPAGVLAVLGVVYLGAAITVVPIPGGITAIFGVTGEQAVTAVASLIVATAVFSAATFIVLVTLVVTRG